MSQPRPLFKQHATAEIESFSRKLPTRAVGKRLCYHRIAESTNDLANRAAREGAPHGLVIIADEQSRGRGRRGRSWLALPCRGLLFSVLVRYKTWPASRAGWLALSTGLAVAEAIEAHSKICVGLKWPNDLVVTEKRSKGVRGKERPHLLPWRKLGGILCEGQVPAAPSAAGFAIIGIGLNVLQAAQELPETDHALPTSLRVETGKSVSRKALLASILEHLEARLDSFEDERKFLELHNQIEARMALWSRGKILHVRSVQGEQKGRFLGLDEFGRMRMERAVGGEIALADAEIVGAENTEKKLIRK